MIFPIHPTWNWLQTSPILSWAGPHPPQLRPPRLGGEQLDAEQLASPRRRPGFFCDDGPMVWLGYIWVCGCVYIYIILYIL
jgi:hypothetical protein